MSKTFRLPKDEPLLNLASFWRGGPGRTDRLTPAQVEHIRLTVNRAPEVMVKVLPRASNDLTAVGKHLDYISRHGKLALETDDGERLTGRAGQELLDDWDLDIDDVRRQARLAPTKGRKPPKLVHKLMFSMPAGTPPEKVLGAVRNFAREQFWGQHRYAFALHTDEDHPHVHLVLKAVSEQGVRCNINKAMLRHWRSEFARNLRLLGVAANASERAVRGQTQKAKKDGIYRASLRGDSTSLRAQTEAVAAELLKGNIRIESGKRKLLETRKAVEEGWQSVARLLAKGGRHDLAEEVSRFVNQMPAALTEREVIARELVKNIRATPQREYAPTR